MLIRSFFLLFIVFTTSCITSHHGSYQANALSDSDCYLVHRGIGTAKVEYFFGIGGNNQRRLIEEAKKDLEKHYPLRKGQTYANVSLEWKRGLFGFYDYKRLYMNADIVDCNGLQDTNYVFIPEQNRLLNRLFLNQKVSFYDGRRNQIGDIYNRVNKNYIVVKYSDRGQPKYKEVHIKEAFTIFVN